MQNADQFIIDTDVVLPYELKSLAKAVRYQEWIIKTIQPFLGRRILELGAGIGNMSRWLTAADYLLLTESDPALFAILKKQMHQYCLDSTKLSLHSFNAATSHYEQFDKAAIDTVVSFNVLEHIEHDIEVIQHCANLLNRNKNPTIKRIISFVPAHQWAYGEMDKQVGHYRRYTREHFRQINAAITPQPKLILKSFNLIGLIGWVLHGKILKKSVAGTNTISLFETLTPFIKLIDKILIDIVKIPFGQSLLAIQEFSNGDA